jgi:mRNA deadenylase 3'-5' endonuclease subunit Ccr4
MRRAAVVSLETLLAPHQSISSKLAEIHAIHKLPELYSREWMPLTQVNPETFRVMQFNILAEGLSAHPQTVPPFPSSNGEDLEPSNCGDFDADPGEALVIFDFEGCRRWRIIEEILNVSPDILALEECDHFDDFFFPILESLGYSVSLTLSSSHSLTIPREDFNQNHHHHVSALVSTAMVLPSSGKTQSLMKFC